ncbi:MAG: beta-ketoacyl-ACP synthase III [Chitinophagales bacterium]|nr:beta-ketoacyl-ACP synthase III [Chitinophagales bacterium]
MNKVYIVKSSKFLPNEPVSNDEMESYLGKINDTNSRARAVVLRNNGIKTRYYALDKNGNQTHTNAQLTAEAIKLLFEQNFTDKDLELLSCGTTTPDVLLPSHAAMVHGLLKNRSVELNSSAGICNAGMNALKYGYMSIMCGNTTNAVCTGSERLSPWMLSSKFEGEVASLKSLKEEPIIAFKKEFLRWMLSDGAGAVLLKNKPNTEGVSLEIKWIDYYSYAFELETCMYAGGDKMENGEIKSWLDYEPKDMRNKSLMSFKQDIKLLDEYILSKGIESLEQTVAKRNFKVDEIDYFLPHVSSNFFVEGLYNSLKDAGYEIPKEKWFMNLSKVGNVGAASIYLMIEELMNLGQLKKGQKIMLSVPESGRFSYTIALLEVV